MFTSLDSGLTLKSVASERDAERLITFNGQIFGDDVAALTRSLMLHHPHTRPDYWLYIEDQSEIVSALVLIPWEWRYAGVTLKAGEMGIVGTRESHRNRGLIRALDLRFKQLLRDNDFHLSPIQGIPYFYRQFGYEYALPLEAQWTLELRQLTAEPQPGYTVRLATLDDIPTLMRLYAEAASPLDLSAERDAATWRYLLEHAAGTATEAETWLLLDNAHHPVGYWRISRYGFGEGLIVSEASRLSVTAANALLVWLKQAALERHKPYIRFNLPASSDLIRIAQGYGAHDNGAYHWQIHVVDAARLLRQLTPVLESRLAASPFAGLNQRVYLNLYREAVELYFDHGQLRKVTTVPAQGAIRLPPNLLAPLVLGYRTRADLAAVYPDVSISGESQFLIDVLFPRMESFIYTNY